MVKLSAITGRVQQVWKIVFMTIMSMFTVVCTYSQVIHKCGYSFVHNEVAAHFPEKHAEPTPKSVAKLTAGDAAVVIPVVFHVVLTDNQLKQLGGETLIPRYIDSQVAVINRDFNAQNKDSVLIPDVFKPLFGNAHISFALARTAPDGSATPGYEIRTTIQPGFNLGSNNTYGSKLAFSDAKYKASGGLDAWDPTTYLNIWIIKPMDNNSATDILGLTIPPSFVINTDFPSAELGVILGYESWVNALPGFNKRTLTHEIGHYLALRHIWGDDDAKCPDNGGEDDDISDTPPQSRETYGCPVFPRLDACTKTGGGIMFMNYMDYTNDNCQHLFTHGQVVRMREEIAPFAYSYGLTQHPGVLVPPAGTENTFTIYPNPGDGRINIRFDRTSNGVKGILITDMTGRVLVRENITGQQGLYYFDISHAGRGIYFVRLETATGKVVQKVVVK